MFPELCFAKSRLGAIGLISARAISRLVSATRNSRLALRRFAGRLIGQRTFGIGASRPLRCVPAKVPSLSRPRSGYGQCVLLLRRVNSDSFGILLHGPPSVHEARLGSPDQPSYSTARPGRAAGLRPHGHNV